MNTINKITTAITKGLGWIAYAIYIFFVYLIKPFRWAGRNIEAGMMAMAGFIISAIEYPFIKLAAWLAPYKTDILYVLLWVPIQLSRLLELVLDSLMYNWFWDTLGWIGDKVVDFISKISNYIAYTYATLFVIVLFGMAIYGGFYVDSPSYAQTDIWSGTVPDGFVMNKYFWIVVGSLVALMAAFATGVIYFLRKITNPDQLA